MATTAHESAGGAGGQAVTAVLQAQLMFLGRRLELLERENQMLLQRVSNCPRCSKFGATYAGMLQEHGQSEEFGAYKTVEHLREICSVKNILHPAKNELLQVDGGNNELDKYVKHGSKKALSGIMNHHPKRFVALKIVYFGQRFYGFASEAQKEPTIESEIFKALEKTKLLAGDKQSLCYSRCGRTDKGVSSTGQVISLYLRSKVECEMNMDGEENSMGHEIDYVRVLNKILPGDIRVIGWSAVSADFHASSNDSELWAMSIKGTAFLWHQVRCMVAVLFMIGEGHESPSVIDSLLDTSKIYRKPQYTMAPELPLVLRSCEFGNLKFNCTSDAMQALHKDLRNTVHNYLLQAAIFREALRCLPAPGENECLLEDNKKNRSHIPLLLRPTEPSYEERRAKLDKKKNNSSTGISKGG